MIQKPFAIINVYESVDVAMYFFYMYIINCPRFFRLFFQTISPHQRFSDAETQWPASTVFYTLYLLFRVNAIIFFVAGNILLYRSDESSIF